MRIGHESSSAVIQTTKYRAVASAEESDWDYYFLDVSEISSELSGALL